MPKPIIVETKWETDPEVFKTWEGSVIAYGRNDDKTDWVSGLYFDSGKAYGDPSIAVEDPDCYIPMERIKAVVYPMKELIQYAIVKEVAKSGLPKQTIPTTTEGKLE